MVRPSLKPVADTLRKAARHDVAVADRLDFVDAEVLDALVERTRRKKINIGRYQVSI